MTLFALLPRLRAIVVGLLCGGAIGAAEINDAVFINEIHYANFGGDINEFVEVAGPSNTELGGYEIVLYGGDGKPYRVVKLTGSIDGEGAGLGASAFRVRNLRSGLAGLALVVVDTQEVIELLSYEGEFEALSGPAAGMRSVNIGAESPGRVKFSLQRIGVVPDQFIWEGPLPQSFGTVNVGQIYGNSALD